MTIDEAIKQAEKVAEKNEKKARSYPRPNKNIRGSGRKYNDCIECASEHRQLAEWLKELKRYKEQKPILDKIRAEIESITFDSQEIDDEHESLMVVDLDDVLQIIDKYKAESEDKV